MYRYLLLLLFMEYSSSFLFEVQRRTHRHIANRAKKLGVKCPPITSRPQGDKMLRMMKMMMFMMMMILAILMMMMMGWNILAILLIFLAK